MMRFCLLFVLPELEALVETTTGGHHRRQAVSNGQRLPTLPQTPPRPIVVPAPDERPVQRQPSEYDLNVGRCIDTLRADLPVFFDQELTEDIYTENIEFADPSGVQLQGKHAYRQVFGMIRLLRRLTAARVESSFRLRYNDGRIHVRWHTKWSSSSFTFYVDCISHYDLSDDGLIQKHVVERVNVNSRPLTPPYGRTWMSLREHLLARVVQPQPAFSFLPDKCDNIWDCEAPLSCCDFGFFKVCCDQGVPAFAPIPIPVPVDPYPYPPQSPPDF